MRQKTEDGEFCVVARLITFGSLPREMIGSQREVIEEVTEVFL